MVFFSPRSRSNDLYQMDGTIRSRWWSCGSSWWLLWVCASCQSAADPEPVAVSQQQCDVRTAGLQEAHSAAKLPATLTPRPHDVFLAPVVPSATWF